MAKQPEADFVEPAASHEGVTRSAFMNKNASLLIIALTLAPIGAHAAITLGPDVSAAFGNTLMTIDPDGRSRKVWLQPDGTWSGLSRRGLDLAGKWTLKGDKVCLSQSKPRLFGSMCETLPTDEAGVLARDPTGSSVRLKLVKGHVIR